MSASNSFENALLLLILNAITIADLAEDIQGSPSGLAVLWVSLHTADPGEAGNQGTSETAYLNYGRIPVVRTSAGFTVAGNVGTNAAEILFPSSGGSGADITHFGLGHSASGPNTLYLSGALQSAIPVAANIQPRFAPGTLTITAD